MKAPLLLLTMLLGSFVYGANAERVPVIDITDLYHPHQDPGDNLDLIAAYALPEVALKAVVFDVTEEYRKPVGQVAGLPADDQGPREPGFIQVHQLNRIFNRDVPCAAAPFRMMRSPDDKMLDAPAFEQAGIELMMRVLQETTQPVEIVSFGSARPLAVAYNRNPELLRQKVRKVHLSLGSSDPGFLEWNTLLDPKGVVCLLRSPLPIAIYPCGTKDGAFAYGTGNTFWRMPNRKFLLNMAPPLRRYCAYSFERSSRRDFLRALEDSNPADFTTATLEASHNVWETAIWLDLAHWKIVRNMQGKYRMLPHNQVQKSDSVLTSELVACTVDVKDSGEYVMHASSSETGKWMYRRGDPHENEAALREAFPAWYCSIQP